MKIKKITACLISLVLIVSVVNLGFILKDTFFDNIETLPEGEFLYSSLSPDGENTVSVYKVKMPGGFAIRGAAVSLDSNGKKQERNIFWQLGSDSAIVGWISNNTVSINDHIVNISSGMVYDSRNDHNLAENLD